MSLTWLDRSRSIARSTAVEVSVSLFGDFVAAYNELENDFIGGTRA